MGALILLSPTILLLLLWGLEATEGSAACGVPKADEGSVCSGIWLEAT